jgi:polysaccharide biosynthesis/export protein
MKIAMLLGGLAVVGLTGCGTIPTAGPTTSQVMDQAAKEPHRFDMVEIDSRVVAALLQQPGVSLRDRFEHGGQPPHPTIGIGDTVSVSIWQAPTGQVFGAAPGGNAAGAPAAAGPSSGSILIPDQVVGADGGISVPYAGRIPAAGRTPFQVQQTIEQRLAEQLIQPQAIVALTKSVSDSVTVSGEQVTGARVPLSVGGDRLMDVIAAAGGSKSPVYETFVRLTRHGETATIPMETLLSNPAENIYAWPGDVITLEQQPATFSVFGATLNNTQVPFGAEKLNLAQAVAKAGGLQDQRADPEGVFLFRFEPPPVVNELGARELRNGPQGDSPVLYHLNLRQVDSYFLAERFPMRDDDLIYVANAPMTEVQKFFTLLGTITGPVISGAIVSRGSGH